MVSDVGISTSLKSVATLGVDSGSNGTSQPLTLSSDNGTIGDITSMILSTGSIVSSVG